MPLGTFIAGRYSCTYNATDIGIAEKGYNLSWTVMKEKIKDTDVYADSDVDGIYRGMNVFLQTTCKEYKTGSVAPTTPYNTFTPTGATSFEMGLVGRLDSNLAQALVLSSTASTPAAASPASITASLAILDAGFSVDLFFGPTQRKVPIRWQLYPYLSTTVKYFSAT